MRTRPGSPTGPPMLDGCDVLPPMGPPGPRPDARADRRTAQSPLGKRKGSPGGRRSPHGRRFQTINAFADATLRDLDRAQIAVWLLLWRDTKPEGLARTSQTDLARRAGASTRTMERAIRNLERAGLLTVVRRGGVARGPSTYRVHPTPRRE